MNTQKEIEAKFTEATEHLFHVSNILGSGINPTSSDSQRELAREMVTGLAKLGQAIQLHLNHIEQQLYAVARAVKKA